MFERSHFRSYSTSSRICIGLAVLSAVLLVGIIMHYVAP